MTLSEISELFISGHTNRDVAALLVEKGISGSIDTARKGVGLVRILLDSGNSAEAMVLTARTLNGEGGVTSERYTRRSLQDENIPDHLKIDALTTSPTGGQWRKYKSRIDTGNELREQLLKEVQPLNITYRTPANTGEIALEIVISDHHFGKIPYSYKPEDWSLETAKREYLAAIEFHLSKAPLDRVGKIILPVGNDLLHINSNTGTTKKGTPMEYRENYHRLYAFVRDVVAGSVVSLSKRFNIIIPIVPGNHDEDACYRLGDYLEGLFKGSDRVTIDNSGHDRKYIAWGDSLLMYTHGEKVKNEKLHDAFSVDVAQLNAKARYRYVHVGHLHKNAKNETWRRNIKDEYLGTEVEICPSLCPTDNWHFDNMYTGNQRRSKSFHYALTGGKVGEVYYAI